MDSAKPNLLTAMIEALIASQESEPAVIFSDPVFEKIVELLPATWHRETASPESFPAQVSAALLQGPVVAFPPWGREQRSRESFEVVALQGIQASARSHALLAAVPSSTLVSVANESFRAALAEHWEVRAVATCDRAIPGVDARFVTGLILLDPAGREGGLLRMFEAPHGPQRVDQEVIQDLQRLLRMKGGTTDYGYVLRESLDPRAPLAYRLHDPRVVQRRAELGDYGKSAQLGDLFEIWSGEPILRLRMTELEDAHSPGSGRMVTGREVLSNNEIAPEDEASKWVQSDEGYLQAGDIVVRALQNPSVVRPGLVWAQVSDDDLPLIATDQVAVLRPRESTRRNDIDFVLRYLSSRHAVELLAATWSGSLLRATPRVLAVMKVPLPDAHLAEALASVESARLRADEWADEANQILDSMFSDDTARISRQNVIERSRIVRLRIQAVNDVETLGGQVRTQYPFPIAYRWRVLDAALSRGRTYESYSSALDLAEQIMALTANIGLALAHQSGLATSAVEQISDKLARGEGPTMGDWSNVLDELAGRKFAAMDALIATTEFRRFCADETAKAARQELRRRRNNESHQRKVLSHELAEACSVVSAQLEVLLKQLSFFLDSPLALARDLRWDSIDHTGSLAYQKLSGDHSVVPIQELTVNDPGVESGSLYLLDSDRKLHLLRPFLVGMNCENCGAFSIFHIDRFLDGKLTMKSMEHGHQIDASDQLLAAVRRTGLLKA